jgi:membrane protease YdiL (CAAX protease family)
MYAAFRMATNPKARIDDLATDGNLWSFATVLSTPAAVGLVLLLIYLRRYPIRGYLALYWPSRRSLAISFVGLLALIVATDLTTYLLGKPLVPRVMADVFRTGWMPGLLLAVLVLAPIGEETLFRGFLYTGIAASRAGPIVAIAVSSIIFALMHVQYDWYGVVAVAAIGLYLGVVRYRAQSLLLTMLLHSVASMIATTELFVEEYWLG